MPYERRRELLAELGFDGPSWQSPAHHVGDGEELLAAVRARGLEGIVAKRSVQPVPARAPQRRLGQGAEPPRQELVIGGWMPGEGGRARASARCWSATGTRRRRGRAARAPARLVYAGGVGTGFTQATLEMLRAALEPLRREQSPFELGWDPEVKYAARARERGGLDWVEPELVCEVEFPSWTHEDTLRAASFKGLRDDKDPAEVVREA